MKSEARAQRLRNLKYKKETVVNSTQYRSLGVDEINTQIFDTTLHFVRTTDWNKLLAQTMGVLVCNLGLAINSYWNNSYQESLLKNKYTSAFSQSTSLNWPTWDSLKQKAGEMCLRQSKKTDMPNDEMHEESLKVEKRMAELREGLWNTLEKSLYDQNPYGWISSTHWTRTILTTIKDAINAGMPDKNLLFIAYRNYQKFNSVTDNYLDDNLAQQINALPDEPMTGVHKELWEKIKESPDFKKDGDHFQRGMWKWDRGIVAKLLAAMENHLLDKHLVQLAYYQVEKRVVHISFNDKKKLNAAKEEYDLYMKILDMSENDIPDEERCETMIRVLDQLKSITTPTPQSTFDVINRVLNSLKDTEHISESLKLKLETAYKLYDENLKKLENEIEEARNKERKEKHMKQIDELSGVIEMYNKNGGIGYSDLWMASIYVKRALENNVQESDPKLVLDVYNLLNSKFKEDIREDESLSKKIEQLETHEKEKQLSEKKLQEAIIADPIHLKSLEDHLKDALTKGVDNYDLIINAYRMLEEKGIGSYLSEQVQPIIKIQSERNEKEQEAAFIELIQNNGAGKKLQQIDERLSKDLTETEYLNLKKEFHEILLQSHPDKYPDKYKDEVTTYAQTLSDLMETVKTKMKKESKKHRKKS